MKQLHLDSEYRRRWQEYHTADGRVYDSRKINWRHVEWEKVVKIVTFMNRKKHVVKCSDPRFQFFMCFRWGGVKPVYKHGEYVGHGQIKLWTIGWSDGKKVYLKDIDFYTGNLEKEYESDLKQFRNHIHPRVQNFSKI